jgi:hypothetical protein
MDFNKEQLLELTNILLKSKAVSYEPNARPLLCNTSAIEKYYVSDNDGHLTINYNQLAQDVFAANFRKQVHGEWIHDKSYEHLMKCSICDYYEYESMAKGEFRNFCPNCGAKMKGNN